MKLWNKISPRSKNGPVQNYAHVFHQQIEADHINRGIPRDVEGFRAKFSRNLIGQWQTEPDSDIFTTTTWEFFADGSARQLNHSQIVGDNEVLFRWREKAYFLIELCLASADDDNPNWFPIHYNFKPRNGQVVLVQMPESAAFKFYLTTDYPVFQGDNK